MNKYRIERELVKACSSDEVDTILSEINDIDDTKEIIKMLLSRINMIHLQQMINNISNNTSGFGLYSRK